ncbi:MAG: alginate export family protein [Immundisolibacter sp.]
MRVATTYTSRLIALALAVTVSVAGAQDLLGRKVKLTGQWDGVQFQGTRLQVWDTHKDSTRGRIRGKVEHLDVPNRTLRIGPISVEWDLKTRWEGLAPEQIASMPAVEVSGAVLSPAKLRAKSVRPASIGPGQFQLRGTVMAAGTARDAASGLTLLGVPVEVPSGAVKNLYGASLTRRPDERRPSDQFSAFVLGRPLTIGGELKTQSRYLKDLALNPQKLDDVARIDQELQIEVSYPLNDRALVFLEGKVLYEAEVYAQDKSRKFERSLERGEMWLYLDQLFASNFSLQIGRQNFYEPRSWWWDQDLDAVRFHYNTLDWHAELSVARELGDVATELDRNDPQREDVLRVLGHTAWRWARNHRLDAFFLYHDDRSERQRVGELVTKEREDPSDATLIWAGGRLSGELDFAQHGEVDYWIEGAAVRGHERLLDFDRVSGRPDRRVVDSRAKRDVSGWAFESGVSWQAELPARPTLTLSYAFGSGDRNPGHGADRSFRQTGLQGDKARFGGVDRFRYYGELLNPELSNLHIPTAAVGFSFWDASSVEFLYHHYRQVHAADFLRNGRVRSGPDGRSTDIGQEFDIVLGLEDWEPFEIEAVVSAFRAGAAYGSLAGNMAYAFFLNVDYNF